MPRNPLTLQGQLLPPFANSHSCCSVQRRVAGHYADLAVVVSDTKRRAEALRAHKAETDRKELEVLEARRWVGMSLNCIFGAKDVVTVHYCMIAGCGLCQEGARIQWILSGIEDSVGFGGLTGVEVDTRGN